MSWLLGQRSSGLPDWVLHLHPHHHLLCTEQCHLHYIANHRACRFERLRAVAWLLGQCPPGLPPTLPLLLPDLQLALLQMPQLLLPPHAPSDSMLVSYSKSGWLPLHSLLREAGEKQEQQLKLQQENDHISAQRCSDQTAALLQLARCWVEAVQKHKQRAGTSPLLEQLDSRPYIWYGCRVLMQQVCNGLGYVPHEPRCKGVLKREVEELRAKMDALSPAVL